MVQYGDEVVRHLSCDHLNLKLKHSLCQDSRIFFNVVLNLMKDVKIKFLPPVYVTSTSASSKLTKMSHHLCGSPIVK